MMPQLKNQIAPAGDFHGIFKRARKVGKQLRHFFLCVKILAFIEMVGTPFIGENLSFGNTGSGFMRGKFFPRQKLDRMGGNHRQLQFVRQLDGMSGDISGFALTVGELVGAATLLYVG